MTVAELGLFVSPVHVYASTLWPPQRKPMNPDLIQPTITLMFVAVLFLAGEITVSDSAGRRDG